MNPGTHLICLRESEILSNCGSMSEIEVRGCSLHMSKNGVSTIQQEFKKALRAATSGQKFDHSAFIDVWFRDAGSAFYFLFKKHLGVTNIQMAELFALIRSHLTFPDAERPHLRFLSIPEFTDSLKQLLETFTHPNVKDRVDVITSLYTELYQRTIVIDAFYGSCAVYVPPTVSLDIDQICSESGYIHSCGATVFIEKVYKTQMSAFAEQIRKYAGSAFDGKNIIFTAYAREDWPDKEEKMPGLIAKGIEEVKIPVSKFFMGRDPVQDVLTKLAKQCGGRLKVARPGHLREDQMRFEKDDPDTIDRGRTLFLVVDRQIGDNPRHPADTRFFICYEQRIFNSNPCHVFDEDKPAWIDHTTIPHTLMGAMINVTQPWWPKRSTVKVCDPFVGSGTSWLEALKYPRLQPVCSDLHLMAFHLANENLSFFAKSKEELTALKDQLATLALLSPTLKGDSPFERAKRFYLRCMGRVRSSGKPLLDDKDLLKSFTESDELFRYAFYLIHKVERRSFGMKPDDDRWADVFRREINQQINAIIFLLNQKVECRDPQSRVEIGQGRYSRASTVNYSSIHRLGPNFTVFSNRRMSLKEAKGWRSSWVPFGFRIYSS